MWKSNSYLHSLSLLTNALFVSRNSFFWKPFSPLFHVWSTWGKLVRGNWIPVNGKKKKSLHARKVFFFPYSKENTFLFLKRALTSNDCKGLIWWGQWQWQPMLLLSANVFFYFNGSIKIQGRWKCIWTIYVGST